MSISHMKGDMFKIAYSTPFVDWALAHCISEDCAMGKGIAVEFNKRYGQVPSLKLQVSNGKKKGTAAYLEADDRLVFYLITKEKYFQKPTYESLEASIKDMLATMAEKDVQGCVMPRIGCGLDLLEWPKVEIILGRCFAEAKRTAIVCTR